MVGQIPPPFHGQAIATKVLFDHDWSEFDVQLLPMRYSRENDEVGRFGLGKVLHLFGLVLRAWRLLLKKRGSLMYYLPASPNTVPVLRDIVFLILVRPFARGVVFHYHAGGLPQFLEGKPLLAKVAKFAYRRPLLSVEISESDPSPASYFNALERVIVPNGLDVPEIERTERGVSIRVLYVGSLSEGKGILDLIETARLLDEEGVAAEFEVVGEWQSKDGEAAARERLADGGAKITFSGRLTGDDKWAAYGRNDLFFFPSHYASENFPLVLIEAMGAGLPVVATQWRGIPQLVEDGESGELYPINDPAAYAKAITELAADPPRLRDLGSRGREIYLSKYTKSAYCGAMERALDRAFELTV
jgi:glycosyltransferase involved in cell wall biosynthesis